MAKKTNTSSKSVDGSQTNFLNFQPKTQREQDLYNMVNGRLQEFAAVDPEYADVMENFKTSSEYTIPSAPVALKHQETVPQEPVFSKIELEEKIQSEVQKEVHREVQKVVAQEVQKEVQRIVPEEVQKAVEKIAPVEAPKHVAEAADDDFIESNVGNLIIEENEQQVSQSSNYEENGDNDDDTLDKVKRVLLILVFIGLLSAVIFFSLRRCSNAPEASVVVPDTTMQEPNSVQEEKSEPAVEPQISKSIKTDFKIEDLESSTPKSTKSEKNDKVSEQQPITTAAKETKPTQPKAAKADNSLAKSISDAVESTKTAESVKIAELKKAKEATKTEETTKVVEPSKVAEPAKTEVPVKVEEPAKVAEPTKAEEPVKVAEPAKVVVPEKTTQPQAIAPKQEPEPTVAKDLPFQEKNTKQAVPNTAPTAAKAPVAKAPVTKTPAPAPKPVMAPVKVATTKPTTDDLKDLEKQKDNAPRICTPDKVPTQGYVISYSTTKNESTAIKTVMIITRTKHLPCGYYWLGDSKTQKKASLFRVYVGPYKTEAEAQAALTGILDVAPDAKVYSENPAKK